LSVISGKQALLPTPTESSGLYHDVITSGSTPVTESDSHSREWQSHKRDVHPQSGTKSVSVSVSGSLSGSVSESVLKTSEARLHAHSMTSSSSASSCSSTVGDVLNRQQTSLHELAPATHLPPPSHSHGHTHTRPKGTPTQGTGDLVNRVY